MSNILVTGSNGQLGSEIRQQASGNSNFFFTDINELDITDKKAIIQFCQKHSITTIINCAAYTAVDKAESEFELADKINHRSVEALAEVAKEQDIRTIVCSVKHIVC